MVLFLCQYTVHARVYFMCKKACTCVKNYCMQRRAMWHFVLKKMYPVINIFPSSLIGWKSGAKAMRCWACERWKLWAHRVCMRRKRSQRIVFRCGHQQIYLWTFLLQFNAKNWVPMYVKYFCVLKISSRGTEITHWHWCLLCFSSTTPFD